MQNISTPMSHALPNVTYVSAPSSQGSCVPMNVEETLPQKSQEQQIQQELEKEEIMSEIIADESLHFNPRMNNPVNDVTMPDVVLQAAKYTKVIPLVIDAGEKRSSFTSPKKSNNNWRCALCQINTTSERGLQDHFLGKKHKAKEAILRTPKKDTSRSKNRILQPCLTLTDTCILKSTKKDLVVLESKDLDGLETKSEATTEQEESETKELTPKKKFKFWCAFCDFEAHSETIMKNHKIDKMHVANMKKLS